MLRCDACSFGSGYGVFTVLVDWRIRFTVIMIVISLPAGTWEILINRI